MNYGEIETELTERLRDYFAAHFYEINGVQKPLTKLFDAFEMPEDAKQMDRAFTKATVYVQFEKSEPGPVKSINQVSQDEALFVHFIFNASYNRGLGGLYELVAHVKKALLGYRPAISNTRMLIVSGPNWEQYENGSIKMGMSMKFSALAVQDFNDEPADGALATKVEYI